MCSDARVNVAGKRCLLLGCSRAKRHDSGLLPALERYDGPSFRVLRRYLRANLIGDANSELVPDVYVLSAEFGLIPGDFPIPGYDRQMTVQRAVELHEIALNAFGSVMHTGYTELCLAMSAKYLTALVGWPTLVPSGTSVTVADGPQGLKLAQLKCWLWQADASVRPQKQQTVRANGVVRLRGVELRLTSAQVVERARVTLAEDGANVGRFRKWYVQAGGQRVAPKWLVGTLTGLPVRQFTTREALRVLHQLGIHARQISEAVNDRQGAQTHRCWGE